MPPALLVTHRQFQAAVADVVYKMGGAGENKGEDGAGLLERPRLLSAEEKIEELTRMVDTQRGEQEKLGRELEEVQAEKVSMEYLLREKLEKLVQSEIEARLYMYRRDDNESALTQRPMAKLKSELETKDKELQVRGRHCRTE